MFCTIAKAKDSYNLVNFHSEWAYMCDSQNTFNPTGVHVSII
jgi:hypothetical protein